MNTKEIPEGWWLNVTIMARYQDSWIVGVMRKGKSSWITENVISNLETSDESYKKGLEWINKYLKDKNDSTKTLR
jgi:hypothetical protein